MLVLQPGPVDPTPGYHSHESSNHLEYFIFNPDQVVPVAVVHWEAILNTRADIENDGEGAGAKPAAHDDE